MTDITQKIFEFAYGSGLEDAIRQQAFKSDVKTPLRNCQDAKETVKNYINAVWGGQCTEEDFYKTAEQVQKDFAAFIEKYNQDPEDGKRINGTFRFGNAQKLINMTSKFMFILTYDRPEQREKFAQCHCPLDHIMKKQLFKAVDDHKSAGTLPPEIENITTYGWKKPFNEAWSQISIEDYKTYQKLIRVLAKKEEILPIEYDYAHWSPTLDQ